MNRLIAAVLAAVALLAGCGKAAEQPAAPTPTTLDNAALAARLRAVGIAVPADMTDWRARAMKSFCGGDQEVFELSLTIKDTDANHAEYLRRTRAVVEALCPARLPLVDKAIAAT